MKLFLPLSRPISRGLLQLRPALYSGFAVALGFALSSNSVHAQSASSSATTRASGAASASTSEKASATPARRSASRASSAGAWSLPDPDQLVERVFNRIVTHDKPNAIPIREYAQRLVGKQETLAALKQFAGYTVNLQPSAFTSVSDWNDVRRSEFKPCFGEECESPVNSLWLAVTRIERGDLPHELHVWYTTSFASHGPTGPASHTYSFCERWLRVNGSWKYDGFVRVNTG